MHDVMENGDLGPVYGRQWRSWPTPGGREIDQIHLLIDGLLGDPHSRRHIVSAWNVGEIGQMALPPCHLLFQFYVHDAPEGGKPGLSCQLYQRSADLFLGVPFNIASYALLTSMVAHVCGYEPREFVHTFGDLHLYSNHLKQAAEQLTRESLPLPKLWLNPEVRDIDHFTFDDVRLTAYDSHPATNPHFPALQSSPPTSPPTSSRAAELRRPRRLRQAGRSGPMALSGASRRKQTPCSQIS